MHRFMIVISFMVYPLLKRVTYWPQAWLGFAMNFGFVIAWAAVTDSIDWNVNIAMMAGCWWFVLPSHHPLCKFKFIGNFLFTVGRCFTVSKLACLRYRFSYVMA
jgi:4-hydroxybenzoate polyprenyltransferase